MEVIVATDYRVVTINYAFYNSLINICTQYLDLVSYQFPLNYEIPSFC